MKKIVIEIPDDCCFDRESMSVIKDKHFIGNADRDRVIIFYQEGVENPQIGIIPSDKSHWINKNMIYDIHFRGYIDYNKIIKWAYIDEIFPKP